MTSRDDFNRDPVNADEAFDLSLADMFDIDEMVERRLAGGELDRRLEQIKKQADPAGEQAPAVPAACPEAEPASATPWIATMLDPARLSQMLGSVIPGAEVSIGVRHGFAAEQRYQARALKQAAAILHEARRDADQQRAEVERLRAETEQLHAEAVRWRDEIQQLRDGIQQMHAQAAQLRGQAQQIHDAAVAQARNTRLEARCQAAESRERARRDDPSHLGVVTPAIRTSPPYLSSIARKASGAAIAFAHVRIAELTRPGITPALLMGGMGGGTAVLFHPDCMSTASHPPRAYVIPRDGDLDERLIRLLEAAARSGPSTGGPAWRRWWDVDGLDDLLCPFPGWPDAQLRRCMEAILFSKAASTTLSSAWSRLARTPLALAEPFVELARGRALIGGEAQQPASPHQLESSPAVGASGDSAEPTAVVRVADTQPVAGEAAATTVLTVAQARFPGRAGKSGTNHGPQSGFPGPGNGAPPPGRSGNYDHGRDAHVRWLRELAREGRLAAVVAQAQGTTRQALTAAAYEVAWPIVYSRLTRRIEQRRGHRACATGVEHLADECRDRFHDDVEAVVADLLTHARQPILNLEVWITGRLNVATVDGHRRRRGMRGALQRPRLPGWLADLLGQDQWLMALAARILAWVAVASSGTSGEVWPLETWAQERAAHTGDWSCDPAVVALDVETILTAMRRQPLWYESYVERPLGRKQAPVAAQPVEGGTGESAMPLALTDPHARVESEMRRLAAAAVSAIDQRRGQGQETQAIVAEVIRTVFGGTVTGTLDQAPHDVADPLGGVSGAPADPATVDRIAAVLANLPVEP